MKKAINKPRKRALFFSLLLFTCQAFAEEISVKGDSSAPNTVSNCIVNFNKPLCGKFTFSNQVIIKSSLNKEVLEKKLNTILMQIAFLGDTGLYLMQSDEPLKEAKRLSSKHFIDYAQPDIIQHRDFSSNSPKHDLLSKSNEKHKLLQSNLGKGVTIAIIDDGFNLEHEDLQHIDVAFRYDGDYRTLDATPKYSLENHGTKVAGVIFAAANNLGSEGIAPDATLVAIRQHKNITSNTVISFTVAEKSGAQIINCSWNSPVLMQPVYDVITYLARHGREGKGTAIVFAAGNNKMELTPFSVEAAIPDVITVGVNKTYSNFGSPVDVLAPTDFTSTMASGGYGNFGGTSGAASYVTGVLALILAEDKNKKIAELKYELSEWIGE